MSRQSTSSEDIFEGLLSSEQETYLDNLMEELTQEEPPLESGVWKHAGDQEDVTMDDAIDNVQAFNTHRTGALPDDFTAASMGFQSISNSSAASEHAHTPAHQPVTVDLTGENVVDLTGENDQQSHLDQATTAQQMPRANSQQSRPKWKVREASNATPTFPRGTWDVPVLTCMNEAKRPDGEFGLHEDHTGNQKCARVLMDIFPDKFPASTSIKVLASRISSVWNDRDRNKKAEWTEVREMRDEDEEFREEMRAKIRATGLA